MLDLADEVVIDAQQLSYLLPHDGKMCLLEGVLSWDERFISCVATSHWDADNPLRDESKLPVHAGIEYAAQAMAIHGKLCEPNDCQPRLGYLAVLSKIDWYCTRLDDLASELQVVAERLMAVDRGFSYRFSLSHAGTLLLEGSAIVALQD